MHPEYTRFGSYIVYEILPGEEDSIPVDERGGPGWYYQRTCAQPGHEGYWYYIPVGPFETELMASEAAELPSDRHAILR